MDSLDKKSFVLNQNIAFLSKSSGTHIEISPSLITDVIISTNSYLYELTKFFKDVDFDFYSSLGQRNISGFIGEIFVKSFEKSVDNFKFNPHGDGRPDILDITSDESKKYLDEVVYKITTEGKTPLRSKLAPFKYGGLEVKATIGNPIGNYKARLRQDHDLGGFIVGLPRINYLNSITYWGHHTSCENLIGIYYDYNETLEGTPQILAVMHSVLVSKEDWHTVSVGKAGSKKTSNTSLTTSGKEKLFSNVVSYINSPEYADQFKKIGLKI